MSADEYRVIVGLGNPGAEYEHTRHNIGFMVLDRLSDRYGGGGSRAWREREGAAVAEVSLNGERVFLLKPQQFMNRSGESVARFLSYYKFGSEQLVVVYDDIDLPLGSLRFRSEGKDGGHRGVRSIIEQLGTQNFVRIKLGVGRPAHPQQQVSDWVLSKFAHEESDALATVVDRAVDAIEALCEKGLRVAQNRFTTNVKGES